jgi:hypothetical protein
MSAAADNSSPAPSAEGMPTRTMRVAEVHDFAKAIGLSHVVPGRCSTVLMFELYCRAVVPVAALNPAKIVAEVRALEGVGPPVGTASEEQFDDPALHGLWKKHYLEDGLRSLAKNIVLGFGKKRRGLRRIIEAHHTPATAHLPPEKVSANIANAVINVYAERSRNQSLTGEWIIFAKHEGKNYYLSLASHDEVRSDPGSFYERIKQGCSGEFPFLF